MFKALYLYIYLSLLLLIAPVSQLHSAENQLYRFTHLTNSDGLSHNYVYCALRDTKGFMWFGTLQGLSRFDGYDFKVFVTNNTDSLTLSHNTVKTIFEYKEGIFLVGTNNGLNLFDAKKDKFYRFYHNPSDSTSLIAENIFTITRDSDSTIWIGTNLGLCKCHIDLSNEGSQLSFSVPPLIKKLNKKIKNDNLVEFYRDTKKNIWIGTSNNGVCKVDLRNNHITQYNFVDSENNPVNTISGLAEYNDQMWVAAGTGAHTIDMKTGKTKSYFAKDGLSNNSFKHLLKDSKNRLWLASYDGLFLYTKESASFKHFANDPQNRYSLNNNFIRYIYDDGHNRIWIATERGGINILDENTKDFHALTHQANNQNSLSGDIVNAICTDKEGNAWIGTSGFGLNYYNRKEKTFTHYRYNPQNPASLSMDFISACYIDSRDNLWIGTWGKGMNLLSAGTSSETFKKPAPQYQFITGFIEDKYNRLWVATASGVLIRNNNSGKFHLIKIPQTPNGTINYLGDLSSDHYGNIYVPTINDGLFVLKCLPEFQQQINLTSKDVLHLYSSRENANSISIELLTSYTDKAGDTWIGSRIEGLSKLVKNKANIFNADSISFKHYTKRQGLCNDIVLTIQDDKDSNLWISTSIGLSKFNPRTEEFTNYYVEDGLLSNEFFFFAAHKNSKGEMFYGTNKGLVYFQPDSINPDPLIPQVMLTGVKIMNKPYTPRDNIQNERNILPEAIAYTNNLNLSYKDYIFSISFSTASYSAAYKNKFAYKLEGFDKDWIYTESNDRFAQYTNIPGGKYTFRVKASNSDGVWNKDGTMVNITITPPFTQTYGFYILVVLFVFIVVMAIIKLRVARLKNQAKTLENTVTIRTQQLSRANDKLRDKHGEIQSKNKTLESQKDKLEEAYNELEKYKANLEERISERTHELIKAKEKAEESDKLKSAFLANMSHEIRTPLNAILGFSDIIASRDFKKNERDNINTIIQSSGQDLLSLITNIIDLSFIDAGQLELFHENIQINNFLSAIFEQTKHQLQQSKKSDKIELISTIPHSVETDELIVYTDSERLKQVFNQLISNAIKFTHKGTISIGYSLLPAKKLIQFSISDSGIGMSHLDLQGIFDRFRKVDSNTDELYRGAGLGLTLCAGLIELIGGVIDVKSEPEKGTNFTFTLPIKSEPEKERFLTINVDPNKETPEVNWHNKWILVAEDEASNFQLIAALLQPTKVKIEWAHNGKEAINFLEKNANKYALILMDIKMPVMNGSEATNYIKSKYKIPVIAQTAYASLTEVRQYMEVGFDDYLAKPLKRNIIIHTMIKYMH